MRIIILIAIAMICCSCEKDECNAGSEPAPPYGTPSNVMRDNGSDGYASIDFIYNCYNGQYVSVFYVRQDGCSQYEKYSESSSNGICSSPSVMQAISNLSSHQRTMYLINHGYKVEVKMFPISSKSREDVLFP